jgi:nucleotide-binding universal stress UspA family protein
MFRKILLPIDGTGFSNKPIEHALGYAKVARADIVVMSIVPAQGTATGPNGITESVAEAASRIGVHCDMVEFDFASADDAIIQVYKRYCCDVIYLSSQSAGPESVGPAFDASLAFRVLEKSAAPVLLFR